MDESEDSPRPPGLCRRTDQHGKGRNEKQGCLKRDSKGLTLAQGSGEASMKKMFHLRPEGSRNSPPERQEEVAKAGVVSAKVLRWKNIW